MRGEFAPLWNSANDTVWEEYIDVAFMVANGLILSITSVVGIAANIFVILAVYHQKSLQTSSNALVVNLAIIDTLRCVIDCPILLIIVATVYQKGRVDEAICDSHVASFSFSCCIQLLTLSCISAERHQAIARPFKTSQSRRRIMILIPVTWTLAIVVAGFCLMFLKDSPVHLRCKGLQRETSFTYDTFGIYMLFPLWALCFGIITGFYTRIFILVRSHNRKIFDEGTFHPSKIDKTEDKQENRENVLENQEQNQTLSKSVAQVELEATAGPNSLKKLSAAAPLTSAEAPQCFTVASGDNERSAAPLKTNNLETDQPLPFATQIAAPTRERPSNAEQSRAAEAKASRGDASVRRSTTKVQMSSRSSKEQPSKNGEKTTRAPSEMKETRPYVPPSAQLQNPESTSVLLIQLKQEEKKDGGESLPVAAADQASSLPPVQKRVPETEGAKMVVEVHVEGAVCMMSSKVRKERASKKKESKLAKRAGYIILTFLLLWLPLITTILVNFVIHRNKNTQVSSC